MLKSGTVTGACLYRISEMAVKSFNWSGSKYSNRADHGVLGIVFESQFEMRKGKKKEFLRQPGGSALLM